MTKDEIIEMAQECRLIGMRPHLDGIYSEALVAFAKLVAEAERESEVEMRSCCCDNADCALKSSNTPSFVRACARAPVNASRSLSAAPLSLSNVAT